MSKNGNGEADSIEVHTGTVAEFFGLSPAESSLVELRLSLVKAVKRLRIERGLTQAQAGKLIGIRQPAVARLEMGGFGGDPETEARNVSGVGSLDKLFLALAALGGTLADLTPRPGAPAEAVAFLSPKPRIEPVAETQTKARPARIRGPLEPVGK